MSEPLPRPLRAPVNWLLLVLALAPFCASWADEGKAAQTLLHLLDYIGVDYAGAVKDGAIADQGEYDEMMEFTGAVQTRLSALPERPAKAALLQQSQQLRALVENKQAPAQVALLAGEMRAALAQGYAVVTAPTHAPDLARAATLFASSCAGCHGAEGRGDGMLAKGMEPAPTNFHDRERLARLSAYSLYSTVTLGVEGTAMRAFGELSEADRWSLAYYAANFAANAEEKTRGEQLWREGKARDAFVALASTSNVSANETAARFGADAVAVLAYLRANPNVFQAESASPLAFTKRTLGASVAAYEQGNAADAMQHAVSAYLEGFELIESKLDSIDHALRAKIEREMMDFRNMIKNGASAQALRAKAAGIESLLDESGKTLEAASDSAGTNMFSAFLILLREGVEAILILGGIVAFLIRTERRDALRYVHAGWITALVLGVLTWFVATHFIQISGASRELTEGITALLAAAVLLYVGYWMHGKIYAQRWNQFIGAQLKSAMKATTLWGLALLAFLTVYREVFETVLFYQALWAQAGDGARLPIVWGFLAAVAALSVIAWLVFSFGVKLPIKLFFGVSSILIGLLAIVFIGKGVAALQEAGKLPMNPLDVPSVPLLGIYPNLQGVLLQLLILALIVGGYFYTYISAQRAPRGPTHA
jgi:high-affinity iron transporter